eukprot:757964-Hanusia_phi.AAC.1
MNRGDVLSHKRFHSLRHELIFGRAMAQPSMGSEAPRVNLPITCQSHGVVGAAGYLLDEGVTQKLNFLGFERHLDRGIVMPELPMLV